MTKARNKGGIDMDMIVTLISVPYFEHICVRNDLFINFNQRGLLKSIELKTAIAAQIWLRRIISKNVRITRDHAGVVHVW